MQWLVDLFSHASAALGLALGGLKVRGVGLGVAGVLFLGAVGLRSGVWFDTLLAGDGRTRWPWGVAVTF